MNAMKHRNSIPPFEAKQPRSIFIDGVEIPSYQTFWEENMRLNESIEKLESRQRLMTYLLMIQGVAIIIIWVALKQLC